MFKDFLIDVRKQLRLTQREVGERSHFSSNTIYKYEKGTNHCSFDDGVNIISGLGLSVLIENNKIKVTEGLEMTKEYRMDDIDFVNFNSRDAYEWRDKWIADSREHARVLLRKTIDELQGNGFEVELLRDLDTNRWLAEHYDLDTRLAYIRKDGKEILLFTGGRTDIDMFILENLIDDLKVENEQIGLFIEKVIIFACQKNNGEDIFNVFKRNPTPEAILAKLPLLKGYEDKVSSLIQGNVERYFFNLSEAYNPSELTISDSLGLCDSIQTSYAWYAFKVDEDEYVAAEESCDGNNVFEALAVAESYFEEYDDYKGYYEDEDLREDYIIFS